MTSINPSAVNGAWGKINRLRLLWCACPVKTTCARVCAFCIMHVWWSVSMHTHHPHPHELAAGADGMGTALRSTGQELKLRGDVAGSEGGCAASVSSQGFIVLTRRMRVVNSAWLRGSQRHQSRSESSSLMARVALRENRDQVRCLVSILCLIQEDVA